MTPLLLMGHLRALRLSVWWKISLASFVVAVFCCHSASQLSTINSDILVERCESLMEADGDDITDQ